LSDAWGYTSDKLRKPMSFPNRVKQKGGEKTRGEKVHAQDRHLERDPGVVKAVYRVISWEIIQSQGSIRKTKERGRW